MRLNSSLFSQTPKRSTLNKTLNQNLLQCLVMSILSSQAIARFSQAVPPAASGASTLTDVVAASAAEASVQPQPHANSLTPLTVASSGGAVSTLPSEFVSLDDTIELSSETTVAITALKRRQPAPARKTFAPSSVVDVDGSQVSKRLRGAPPEQESDLAAAEKARAEAEAKKPNAKIETKCRAGVSAARQAAVGTKGKSKATKSSRKGPTTPATPKSKTPLVRPTSRVVVSQVATPTFPELTTLSNSLEVIVDRLSVIVGNSCVKSAPQSDGSEKAASQLMAIGSQAVQQIFSESAKDHDNDRQIKIVKAKTESVSTLVKEAQGSLDILTKSGDILKEMLAQTF